MLNSKMLTLGFGFLDFGTIPQVIVQREARLRLTGPNS